MQFCDVSLSLLPGYIQAAVLIAAGVGFYLGTIRQNKKYYELSGAKNQEEFLEKIKAK